MSILGGDVLTQLAFSVYENRGVYAILVGSGLSRAADIPTGWEITLDLVRRVALAQGASDNSDWESWYREKTGKDPEYSALLEEIAASPDERRAVLHSYIEPTLEDREAGRKRPTAAHGAIADLVQAGFVRVIVTTNFDRLLETALRERGVEPTVVGSVDSLRGAEPLTHSACYVLKLHGDYKDARILNTSDELSTYPSEYERLLDRIIDEHGLIVAGWSGAWDHALRASFLRAPSRRYPTYWASRGEPHSSAQELIEHRHARMIRINDADSFFVQLRDRVETLQRTHRQSPQSVELAVSGAKRFVAKAEYRIQLDELLLEEAHRLFQRLDAPDFQDEKELMAGQGISSAGFQQRAIRYEVASEALAKIVGVLGRWGDGAEFGHVLDIIQTQYAKADRGGGIVALIGLRSYPSVLVFTAYALGLVRAGRWETLHRLFDARLVREDREGRRVIETLLGFAWKGTTDDVWQRFEGMERRHTAFADLQVLLFAEWSKSFLGLVPDFERLFERFELLGALAHFESQELAHVEAALAQTSMRPVVWVPFGRVSWDKRRGSLVEELENPEYRTAICSAGFCGGNPAVIDLFLRNFSQLRHW